MTLVKCLVIGYGNSLRGDDGIGIKVAEAVAKWQLSNVRSLARHQLTPELAAELAQVDGAIFVDACQIAEINTVELHPLKPSTTFNFKSHLSDPKVLLSFTQALYGKCPQAWWVMIPGANFALSDSLSAFAQQGIEEALIQIKNLLKKNISCNNS